MGLLDTEQPSAISQMLSLLATNRAAGQPGQQPPLPVAPMMLPSGGPRVGTTPSAGMTPSFNLPSPRPMPRMGLLSDGSAVPPGYENHQNLLGHMHDFVSNAVGGGENLLGRIHDIVQNQLVGDAPQGYDSLLSPDEIQRAKPGILSSLAGGTYTHNLDHLVAMHQLATAVGENQRVMQARHDMADMFPAQPNETPGETEGRIG